MLRHFLVKLCCAEFAESSPKCWSLVGPYSLWLGRYTSTDRCVVRNISGVFTTRSIGRAPVSKQVDKELLKDFQA